MSRWSRMRSKSSCLAKTFIAGVKAIMVVVTAVAATMLRAAACLGVVKPWPGIAEWTGRPAAGLTGYAEGAGLCVALS